jgi:hypothetical protein
MRVHIADAKRINPGKKRVFLLILLPVMKTNKDRKRILSVKQSWEMEKNVKSS